MQTNVEFNLDEEFSRLIVQCIHDAWGDRTKEIVVKNRFRTKNSVPFLRWENFSVLLCDEFNSSERMTYLANRSAWTLPLLYDQESGFLITFMRETRFEELKSEYIIRSKMHYIDLLAHYLNKDLKADIQQLELPFFNNFQKMFEDEKQMPEIIQKFLFQLFEDGCQLKRHVLILFDNSGYDITSVRAVMIDKWMNIVYEENWSSYIPTDLSIIVDEVVDNANVNADPQHGLKYTSKYDKRKNKKDHKLNHKTGEELRESPNN